MNETTQQGETTQLGSRNETTQLASRNETTQICTAVDRLQPPAPLAPPLQQNRLFLPTIDCHGWLGCSPISPSSFLKKYGPMIPPAHKAHQTVSFSGCNGVSTYTYGLASLQMRQFCLLT
ncbi:hypothetical protein TNCV_1807781 [Trichonephila clavipes]|nr:hypothetical protein TNCV_1807781 [Trichonephila clavipes]